MGRTKIQNDQSVNAAALPVSRKAANTDTKDILSGFDTNFNSPLRLFASNPSDAKLNIESNTVTKADGTAVSSPPSQSNVPTVPLTTINFQTGATTGATFDSLTFPTTTVGQYRRLALSLKSNGEIKAQWSDASATLAGLANAGSLFPSTSVNIPIGWIDLQATAATAYKTAGSATSIIENSVSGSPRIYNVGQGSGSGGAGTSLRPNYISNPDAEFDSLGWVKYKDAVASAPEDGVGGSASILWERSTTSPIRGVSDFNFVKDAANRRGEGVAYQFSVERGDLAKQLVISFDYELLSGTFETGDLSVYIIQDPTGTPVVVQPGAHLISAGSVGKTMSHMASFQTDSSVTSYALVFHVASASTQAYSIAFDSISVKNESVYFGSYTQIGARYSSTAGQSIASGATPTRLSFPTRESETLTNVSTSPEWKFTAPVSGLYQIECSANFAISTFTTPNDVSMYLYKKNDKHSLMQSKRVTPIVTEWQSYTPSVTAGVGTITSKGIYWRRNGGNLEVRGRFASGTVTASEMRIGFPSGLIASSDTYQSSTTYLVGEGARLDANRSPVSVTVRSGYAYFTFSKYNDSTYSATSELAGNQILGVGVDFTFFASAAIAGWSASVDSLSISGSTSLSLLAGEWIDVRLAHGESVAKSLSTSATDNYISIQRVSGPPSVAAAESTVGLLVEGNQSGTLSNTFNKVAFDTVTTDSLGGYSSGTYTVQVPGLYDITATVSTTATYAAGEKLVASVFVDGVEKARGQAFSASPGVQGPVGEIIATGSATPPSGCLYADGSAVSRTTYADLFASIGTTYGAGNGTTTFNIPDLRGVFLRGTGSQTIGGITYTGALGTKQGDQMQGHKHNAPTYNGVSGGGNEVGSGNWGADYYPAVTTDVPVSDGTNGTPRTGSETRPANVAVAYHVRFTATPFTIALTSSSSVNVKAVNLKAGQTVDIRVLQEGTGATFNNTQKANFSLSRVAGPFAVPTGNTRGGNLTTDVFTGDGVTKSFTLSTIPSVEANVQVYISGVYQSKNSYTIFGSTITFDEAPPVGESNIEVVSGEPLDINVPGDDTVSTVKIKDLNVTGEKLADGSVSFAKLASDVTNKFSAGYIANGSAEVDTAGWSTYNDGAVAMPVDGTGGAATLTWTRSTSSPIRGVASFRLTKTAANSQGQGVSYPFTIEKADQAKVLTITFDYEVVSGTYADGDVTTYIYDVTNSQIIQPAGYTVQNVASGIKNKHIATFQTSATGTSYRLIFHVASTSASAYVLGIDNVVVGPQTVQYGAPVTDWATETRVAWSGSLTSLGNGTAAYKSRRVGDSLEIEASLNVGSTTATTSTAALRLDLTGITIDGNKGTEFYGNSALGGSGYFIDYSTNIRYVLSPYRASSSQITFHSSANSNDVFKSGMPVAFASGDVVTVRALIPITGWSSTVQMSSDTDTRVVAASYYVASSVTVGASCINYDGKFFDTHNAVTTGVGSWVFKAPVPGYYKVSGSAYTSVASDIQLSKNGTRTHYMTTAHSNVVSFSGLVNCNAGDTLQVYSGQTGTVYGVAGGTYYNVVNIERISGPSTIAASETVACSYTNTAGTSIPAGGGLSGVPFATKNFDTHNAWNGTTFTAPVSGKYQVSCNVFFSSAAWSVSAKSLRVVKGSDAYYPPVFVPSVGYTNALGVGGTILLQMLAGETFYIHAQHNEGSSRDLSTQAGTNLLQIVRIGN